MKIHSTIKRRSDLHKAVLEAIADGWTTEIIMSEYGVHHQTTAFIRRDQFNICKLDGCDIEFFGRSKTRKFCCHYCSGEYASRIFKANDQ